MKINNKSYGLRELTDVLRRNNQVLPIARELILDSELSEIVLTDNKVVSLLQKYREENDILDHSKFSAHLKANYLDEESLQRILERAEKVSVFKEEMWGPRAHSLYLQNKEKYDSISFYLLSSPSKDVIQEIYFRVKDGEETWTTMASQLSSPAQSINPKIGPVAVNSVPDIIVRTMRQHGKFTITSPIRHGNSYYIAELLEIQAAGFDSILREKILNQQLQLWLDNACADLANNITFE